MEKKKVLMVDDDEGFLELMRGNLDSWGFQVSLVSDSRKTMEVFKSESFDIVILDYRMPVMDGLSVLREIRSINNEIPVIMFTGHPDTSTMDGSGKLGISAFVPKECIYADTLASLQTVLFMVAKKLEKKT